MREKKKKTRDGRYTKITIPDYLTPVSNTLEQAAQVGLHMNEIQTEFVAFNQAGGELIQTWQIKLNG